MARPRIFISSTYYDLKYIRASLELFIEDLGFDAILSEKGDIAYAPDRPLDESCYREVENCDVFVLIVGGRYGSESSTESKTPKDFFDRYESITKKEYDSAADKDIPIYVLIERAVHAEYQTFIRNKNMTGIKYAHVDSVNVFLLIENILAKPRNNPVQTFEKFEDIQAWLREQWAGLFRELLRRQSQQQQLAGLSQQVIQLKETNETLKKYLEAVMRGENKQTTTKLIESEHKRLTNVRQLESLANNRWVEWLTRRADGIDVPTIAEALRHASGFEDSVKRLPLFPDQEAVAERIVTTLRDNGEARADLNAARAILHLPPFETPDDWLEELRKHVKQLETKQKDVAEDAIESTVERKRSRKHAVGAKKPK